MTGVAGDRGDLETGEVVPPTAGVGTLLLDRQVAVLELHPRAVALGDQPDLECAGNEAMLLYDMTVEALGDMRVVEHFTIADGTITRLRRIHDTAAVRAAGLGAGGPRAA